MPALDRIPSHHLPPAIWLALLAVVALGVAVAARPRRPRRARRWCTPFLAKDGDHHRLRL